MQPKLDQNFKKLKSVLSILDTDGMGNKTSSRFCPFKAAARVGHVDEAAAGEQVLAAAEVQPLQPREVSQHEGEGGECVALAGGRGGALLQACGTLKIKDSRFWPPLKFRMQVLKINNILHVLYLT
jgi:hypothetical protein